MDTKQNPDQPRSVWFCAMSTRSISAGPAVMRKMVFSEMGPRRMRNLMMSQPS